jgi:hypothetical protein
MGEQPHFRLGIIPGVGKKYAATLTSHAGNFLGSSHLGIKGHAPKGYSARTCLHTRISRECLDI